MADTATVYAFDYEFRGTTDEVTECDACGRTGLKSTVVLRPLDGGAFEFMGSTCAARRLGGRATARRVMELAKAADRARAAAVDHAREIVTKYGMVYGAPVRLQARTFFGFNRNAAAHGCTPLGAAREISELMRWAYDVLGQNLPELAPAPARAWRGTMLRSVDVCTACGVAYDVSGNCMC